MTEFRVGSATDVGQVRSINQDSLLVAPEASLFGVADGMGGHQGGEVASALAVEIVGEGLDDDGTGGTLATVLAKVHEANDRIFTRSSEEASLRGMGTTFVAIALVRSATAALPAAGDADAATDEADAEDGAGDDEEVAWINVGDSRVYLLRDGELRQLSRDHSLVEDLRRGGQLTDEEAAVHPQRNILTRALGIDKTVDVDSGAVLPFLGDRFLLCSDGLYNEVDPGTIADRLGAIDDLDEAATELVRLANEGGGRDNITCVIVEVTDDDGRAARAAEAAAAIAAAAAERAAAGEDVTQGDGVAADPTVDTVELPPASPDDPEPIPASAPGTPEGDVTPPHGSPLPPPPAARVAPGAVGSGAVPTEGPFPTPSDPGFPTDEQPGEPIDDLPFDRPNDDLYSDMDRAGGRHWAFTAGAIAVVVAVLLGALWAGATWWAGRTYHVAADGSEVVIYRGPAGGFLFVSPSVAERTGTDVEDLPDDVQERIADEPEFDSEAKARSFVNNARTEAADEAARQEKDEASTTTTEPDTTTTEPRTTTTEGDALESSTTTEGE